MASHLADDGPGGARVVAQARLAVPADVDEVVRLAGVMYESLGRPGSQEWRAHAREAVGALLDADPPAAVAAVVDDPAGAGRLAASGVALLAPRLPGPRRPALRRSAYVQWVATDPAHRGRGLARAVLTRLLRWLDERDVAVAELHTTEAGAPLYRSLGFAEPPYPAMTRLR